MRTPTWPIFLSLSAGCARPAPLDESRVLDLTYPFNRQTVYWPTARSFELVRVAHGPNERGEGGGSFSGGGARRSRRSSEPGS